MNYPRTLQSGLQVGPQRQLKESGVMSLLTWDRLAALLTESKFVRADEKIAAIGISEEGYGLYLRFETVVPSKKINAS